MATPSRNKYYESPDLSEIKDNLADIMGFGAGSASANSDHISNLRGVSKLEGNMMDNRATDSIWQSLQKILPGMTAQEVYTANLGLTGKGHNRALARTEQGQRPGKVRRTNLLADEQQLAVDSANLRRRLEDSLANNKPTDPRAFETGDAWVKDFAGKQQGVNNEKFGRDMRTLMGIQGVQPSINLDPSGSRGLKRDELLEKESQSEINKDISVIGWNDARRDGYKNVSAANVSKIEQETTNLLDKNGLMKSLNKDRRMEIRNRVLNNIAELDQKTLTEKGKRELLDAKIAVEIERELTQEEKTETQWAATRTEEEKGRKEKAKANQEELKLKDMPAETKLKLEQLTKQNAKFDADTARLLAGEKNQMAMMALNQAKKFKVHNEQEIAKILLPYRKDLLEAQTGNAMKGTFETLMYPNKHLKSPTSTDYADGAIDEPPDGAIDTPPNPKDSMPLVKALRRGPDTGSKGSFGVHNIMKNLQKYFSGGEKGGWLDQMVSEGDLSKEGGEIFASLKGVDTASWNPEQQEAFVNKVVAQSGGTVSSDEAKKILKQSMSN